MDRKIFNNMPGFLISAIQSFKIQLRFYEVFTSKVGLLQKVTKCYEKLQEILMKLSSKQGNREQLRMLFNDVDEKFAIILSRKARKSKQIKKHFELLD